MSSFSYSVFCFGFIFLGGNDASSSSSSSSSSWAAMAKVSSSTSSSTTSVTTWAHVPTGPPDGILGIAQAYRECEDDRKVNICVGAYRDAKGQPWVLPSVRAAENILLETNENKEYLPIEGDMAFVNKAIRFAYGNDIDLNKVAAVQTLSGTGACRIGGAFLAKFAPVSTSASTTAATTTSARGRCRIYIPTPTWGNHWKIFEECGLETHAYRYYDRATNALDMTGLLQDLEQAPDHSIILLHACAHNPTGCDPTLEQWQQIAQVMKQKHHTAFFDSAYQGFATGNAEQDAAALRMFASNYTKQQQEDQQQIPVLLAQSFAKNFGLYGERCGTFSVLCQDAVEKERILSQLRLIIRPMYSSPPKHGSSIVKTVLSQDELTAQYYQECQIMAHRIQEMRVRLVQELQRAGSQHDWSHVLQQIGMFAYTGMSAEMCDNLTREYAIFLTRDGRVSLAGLNDDNIVYVAQAMHAVTDGKSITGGK